MDIRLLPVGVGESIISQTTGRLPTYFTHKHILMFGSIITTIVTVFLPFSDAPNTYRPFVFPAFCLGTPDMVIVYSNSSITIFSYTCSSVAGIAAAVLKLEAVGPDTISSIIAFIGRKAPPTNPPVYELIHQLEKLTKDMWKAAFKRPCCGLLMDTSEKRGELEEKRRADIGVSPG
ncbi:hypothetical protein M408DRAFT_30167 [Serendipita vermifera MAFF 305830]|uniref:Uncharacterized protein n=1 Tax=Serendipita vermifera MAFF 305830 TaxID=933852 RepID=A0A0C3AN46_SERVB|nr:hypothetical protein M408DRAFT_30167 [Serendipita vermifera MAFF 305830]